MTHPQAPNTQVVEVDKGGTVVTQVMESPPRISTVHDSFFTKAVRDFERTGSPQSTFMTRGSYHLM